MDFHHQTRDSTSFLPPFSVESGWRCWRCWFNQSLICDSADMFFWACENQLLPCLNHCGWIGWSSDLASLLTTWFPPNMCCFFPWLDLSMAHFLGAGISWKKTRFFSELPPVEAKSESERQGKLRDFSKVSLNLSWDGGDGCDFCCFPFSWRRCRHQVRHLIGFPTR